MCGRYAFTNTDGKKLKERFKLTKAPQDLKARYNIAPSQKIAVILEQEGKRVLDQRKWGLVPFWAKDPKIGNRMINARAETLAEKPSFKAALTRRRCIIPTNGFYEWKKKGNLKIPTFIHLKEPSLFAFAGLWEAWKAPDGQSLKTCTIITVAPNSFMAAHCQDGQDSTW